MCMTRPCVSKALQKIKSKLTCLVSERNGNSPEGRPSSIFAAPFLSTAPAFLSYHRPTRTSCGVVGRRNADARPRFQRGSWRSVFQSKATGASSSRRTPMRLLFMLAVDSGAGQQVVPWPSSESCGRASRQRTYASASRCRARTRSATMMVMLSAFHPSPLANAAA
jgi:hypothetical protein